LNKNSATTLDSRGYTEINKIIVEYRLRHPSLISVTLPREARAAHYYSHDSRLILVPQCLSVRGYNGYITIKYRHHSASIVWFSRHDCVVQRRHSAEKG